MFKLEPTFTSGYKNKFSNNEIIEECDTRSNDCVKCPHDPNENYNNSMLKSQTIGETNDDTSTKV